MSSVVFFIKQSPSSASSSAASLRQQLATLTTSLQTLTAEKGKNEAKFQRDKKNMLVCKMTKFNLCLSLISLSLSLRHSRKQ